MASEYGHVPPKPPWYKKKRFIIPMGTVALFFVIGLFAPPAPAPEETEAAALVAASEEASPEAEPAVAESPSAEPTGPTAEELAAQAEAERVASEQEEAERVASEQEEADRVAAEQEEADRVAAEQAAAAQGEFGPQPDQQKAFVAHVTTAQAGWDAVDNDLQRGGLKAERDARLCETVPGLTVTGWTGVLTTIDANGDGKGVIAVEIADDVQVKTWNNAFSDMTDETLIDPSSPVFAAALERAEGDVVTFNGEFVSGSGDECFSESSLTLGGAVENPEFIFRFSYLS